MELSSASQIDSLNRLGFTTASVYFGMLFIWQESTGTASDYGNSI